MQRAGRMTSRRPSDATSPKSSNRSRKLSDANGVAREPERLASKLRRALLDARAFVDGDKSRGRVTYVIVPEEVDVKANRDRLGLSRVEFARRFALPVHTVQKWEAGERKPDSGSRAYLLLISRDPDKVEQML